MRLELPDPNLVSKTLALGHKTYAFLIIMALETLNFPCVQNIKHGFPLGSRTKTT